MGLSRLIQSAKLIKGDFSNIALNILGDTFKIIVDFLLFFTQIAFWTAYVVYISHATLQIK